MERGRVLRKVGRMSEEIEVVRAQRDMAEARLRDAREVIKGLLASARPNPTEHPTMHAAWKRAENYLTALGSSYDATAGVGTARATRSP